MSKKCTIRESQTGYRSLSSLKDDDIDLSECPEVTPEMLAKAIVRKGLKPAVRKSQITLRIDSEVLSWFRKHGSGYQTRINSLLKAYMQEKRHLR
ncbi:MAG: BrnA antitoxin family protein [Victivallales bacterium]